MDCVTPDQHFFIIGVNADAHMSGCVTGKEDSVQSLDELAIFADERFLVFIRL